MRLSGYATMAEGTSNAMAGRWSHDGSIRDCRSSRSRGRCRCSCGAVGTVREDRLQPRRQDSEPGGRGRVGVGKGIGDSREHGAPGGAGASPGHGPSADCADGEPVSGHWRSNLECVRLSVSRQLLWFGGASPNGPCRRRGGGRQRRSGHGSIPANAAVRLTGTCPGEGTVQAACIPARTGGAEFRGDFCEEPWRTGPSRSGFRCGPVPRRHTVFVACAWRRVPARWSGRRNPNGRRCDECGWRHSDCGRSKHDRWDSHLPACKRAAHVRGSGGKRSSLADADCESRR